MAGINEKRRWTAEEEAALLAGELVDRNKTSKRVKLWKLSGGKRVVRVEKTREVQVTKFLERRELSEAERTLEKSGSVFSVNEKKGKFAIFRMM